MSTVEEDTHQTTNQTQQVDDEVGDDVLAAFASSYDVSYTSFESAMRSLLARGVNELSKVPPRSAPSGSDSAPPPAKPFWIQCVTKFNMAYQKAYRQSASFKKMFVAFLDTYSSDLTAPLFSDDSESVADSFFKRTERFPTPGGAARAAVVASGGSTVIEGPVVYFDMNASNLYSVCVPIGEMYRSAIKQYISAPASNLKKKLLPTLTLLDFYAVLYHSVPEDHQFRPALEKNLSDLCEAAEAISPGSGPGASSPESATGGGGVGNVVAGLGSLLGGAGGAGGTFEQISKAFASGTSDGLEGAFGTIASMVSTFAGVGGMNPQTADDMANVIKSVGASVGTLVEKITESTQAARSSEDGASAGSGSLDPQHVVGLLGTIFQSGEVQEQLAQTAKSASQVFNAITGGAASSEDVNVDALEVGKALVEEVE